MREQRDATGAAAGRERRTDLLRIISIHFIAVERDGQAKIAHPGRERWREHTTHAQLTAHSLPLKPSPSVEAVDASHHCIALKLRGHETAQAIEHSRNAHLEARIAIRLVNGLAALERVLVVTLIDKSGARIGGRRSRARTRSLLRQNRSSDFKWFLHSRSASLRELA